MTKMLNDTERNELENVNGGNVTLIFDGPRYPSLTDTHYHVHCHGVIENVGDPTHSCVCSKCGEEHYLLTGFDFYTLGIRTTKD